MNRPPPHPIDSHRHHHHPDDDDPTHGDDDHDDDCSDALNETMDSEVYFLSSSGGGTTTTTISTPQRRGGRSSVGSSSDNPPTSTTTQSSSPSPPSPIGSTKKIQQQPPPEGVLWIPTTTTTTTTTTATKTTAPPPVTTVLSSSPTSIRRPTFTMTPSSSPPPPPQQQPLVPGHFRVAIITSTTTTTTTTPVTTFLSRPTHLLRLEEKATWDDDATTPATARRAYIAAHQEPEEETDHDIDHGPPRNHHYHYQHYNSNNNNNHNNNEVGYGLGYLWRWILRYILVWTLDHVNMLRISRILQFQIHFMTLHEAHLLQTILEYIQVYANHYNNNDNHHHDSSRNMPRWKQRRVLHRLLRHAFSNRNVSRFIVQVLRVRYDYFYHWPKAVRYNRYFDIIGQFPVVGAWTRFPATENFPATRNHALASIVRILLGPGNWLTRVMTGGRQGLITDDPHHPAQNLTAEANNFELANRNQYGNYYGRKYTNQFRFEHRLPIDESLIRTFITVPIPTMVNNGVVHTLRQLAKHWHNMVHVQTFGNFAHQRMEQLDPFETIRIHIPAVLLTLSSLRGRNVWDRDVLAPFMNLCTNLDVETDDRNSGIERALYLMQELEETIAIHVSGGIPTVYEPLLHWISSIEDALVLIQSESDHVYELLASVELGIRFGYDIITQTDWKVPSDTVLINAIHDFIRGVTHAPNNDHNDNNTMRVDEHLISNALERTTPRDKRTLIELVQNDLSYTRPAQLLIRRVKTLLQREIRRHILNSTIVCWSKGECIDPVLLEADASAAESDNMILRIDDWYWLESKKQCEIYAYCGPEMTSAGSTTEPHSVRWKHRFRHVASQTIKVVSMKGNVLRHYRVRRYIPVGEAISRAQKALMTIELEHGKKFSFNAFMEFQRLRIPLQRLVVVGQMTCEELDNARLTLLSEIQQLSRQNRKLARSAVEPQNITVVGGGPGGMMACLHCIENCLASGGEMKLFEARDTFSKGGSTYERAQIVRLDARWIATMRYHLGTGFEDVFIPASGETDAQLGNTLTLQGFVEITIKDLENILHVEVSRLWSKGLLSIFTDSRSRFDPTLNALTKYGENLKVDDIILHKVDPSGLPCHKDHAWKVVDLLYSKVLDINDLKVGLEYGVYYRLDQAVLPFILKSVNLDTKMYHFASTISGVDDIFANINDLPSIYPAGSGMNAHADVNRVVLESTKPNHQRLYKRIELHMSCIKGEKFTLDVGNTHVIEAIGKPHNSTVHFPVTTTEPHGVCCLEGLKVSLGMHNFGEKRWGSGILDDIRSLNDQNTRIIGDFTKMVRTAPIVELMKEIITNDVEWGLHFVGLVAKSDFPELNRVDPVLTKIVSACAWLAENARRFRRSTLQTRFFEVGDNFYLGMEFPREYNQWKTDLVDQLLISLTKSRRFNNKASAYNNLMNALAHSIDRLWYFSCLETIRTGDVYNPGARHRVPRLFLINSTTPQKLGAFSVGESFRLADSSLEKYEILVINTFDTIVRNVEGYVSHMPKNTMVKRESNLTRSPDGNEESRVAISTFPVRHYVNHRTMRIADKVKGFVFTFAGDEQASPHFMRYSGLTGACINAMSFNNFIRKAIDGVPFVDRFRDFATETNWSNGEVVQRGTSNNYGEDGFLRPGFSYSDCMEYLYAKALEHTESQQNWEEFLSRDWKIKMAAALIPCGMEVNPKFRLSLSEKWKNAVSALIMKKIVEDTQYRDTGLVDALSTTSQTTAFGSDESWDELLSTVPIDTEMKETFHMRYVSVAKQLCRYCDDLIDFASKSSLYHERVSSELFNQPKPVDSVVDDFAVEAQTLANSLILGAAVGSGILALNLIDQSALNVMAIVLGSAGGIIAFGTMTNVSRYKIRNEEARTTFIDEKFLDILVAVFSMMTKEQRSQVPPNSNPLLQSLDKKARRFRRDVIYYDCGEPTEFNRAYEMVTRDVLNIKGLKAFQKLLIAFITDEYHVNSYVQESLVDVYRAVDIVINRLRQPPLDEKVSTIAENLFYRLASFERRLEQSMQRGPVRWGFVKSRSFWHWDVIVVIRYFYDLVWRLFFWVGSKTSICSCGITPIEIETAWLVEHMKYANAAASKASPQQKEHFLSREVHDFETLYYATRESDIASMIFVSACSTFTASLVFTIARIFSVGALTKLVFVSTAISSIGALLAIFHLVRKSVILGRLWMILWQKERRVRRPVTDKTEPMAMRNDLARQKSKRQHIRLLRSVTLTQLLLTLARFATATAASIAFCLALINSIVDDQTWFPEQLPFWLAAGAFFTAVGSVVFFFVVEYVVRYQLTTELGPFVCSLFQDEINESYRAMQSISGSNRVDAKVKHDIVTWEYTARAFLHQYRFDTVLAADRFGQILQCLQSNGYNTHRPATDHDSVPARRQLVSI